MKKRIIIFSLIIFIFNFNCSSSTVYYYYFNSETNQFDYKVLNSKLKTEENLLKELFNKIEEDFNVNIEFRLIHHTDKSGDIIYGCIVDIKSQVKIDGIFKGPFHRSILIEAVQINTIQPIASNWNYVFWDTQDNPVWMVKYLILTVNGEFIGNYTFDQTHYYTVEATGSYSGGLLIGEKEK